MARLAVAALLAALLAGGRPAWAGDGRQTAVTVHVEDYAGVDTGDWARARQEVAEIFGEAGVSLSWAGPIRVPAQDWPQDGTSRVAVVVTNIQVPFAGDLTDTADVLGRAAPRYARAWVFANRIAAVSATAHVDSIALLARVIAHEIGHLLLPGERHSERGIMQGALPLTSPGFVGFTSQQALAMRKAIRNQNRLALLPHSH